MKTCVLCGKEHDGYGCNPWPLATWQEGQCCDECDVKVLAARIKIATEEKHGKSLSQETLNHIQEIAELARVRLIQ